MSHARSIAKNAGLLFASEMVNKGISFLLLILIARRLGELGYGQYAYAFAFISLFIVLSSFGLDTFLLKEMARKKEQTLKLLGNALGLKLCATLASYGIASIIALAIPEAKGILGLIALVMLHELFTAFNSVFSALFKAHEQNDLTVYSITVDKLLALGSAVAAFSISPSVGALLIGLIAGKALSFLFHLFLASKKVTEIFFLFEWKSWKLILKESVQYWMSRLFQIIYTQIDKVMLGAMAGFAVTGWYSAAATLIDGLFFLPVIVMYANFPVMSRLFSERSHEDLKRVYRKSLYVLLVLAIPLSVGLWMLSDRVIFFVYHGQFAESAAVLRLLSLLLAPLFINYLIGFLLNAIDRQGLFALSGGMAAIMNVLLNIFLIPLLAAKGAALATIITQVVNFAFISWLAARNGYPTAFHRLAWKPLLSASVMGVVLWYLPVMPIVGMAAIGGLVYIAMLLMLNGIPQEETDLVLELLRIKRA
ncbi:MAG: flippase [Nanoarchaeota archaeon]|nr:flippase [Nanoarchaeota archaeon]